MIQLTEEEVEEIIEIAYTTCEKHILKYMNKKDLDDITITIELTPGEDNFKIDIGIELDSDAKVSESLAQDAVNLSLKAVDEYVAEKTANLD